MKSVCHWASRQPWRLTWQPRLRTTARCLSKHPVVWPSRLHRSRSHPKQQPPKPPSLLQIPVRERASSPLKRSPRRPNQRPACLKQPCTSCLLPRNNSRMSTFCRARIWSWSWSLTWKPPPSAPNGCRRAPKQRVKPRRFGASDWDARTI